MRFVVPQFIDIESKVIGPITPRQFIIMIITAGLIFVCYKLADFSLFLLETIFLVILGGTIAFLRINGRPIHYFLLNFIQTLKKSNIRVWKKEHIKMVEKEMKTKKADRQEEVVVRQPLSSSRLSQAALLVDTGGRYQEEEQVEQNQAKG